MRDVLDHAGYTQASILDVLHLPELPLHRVRRQTLPLSHYRLRAEAPLHTLIRLFLLNEPVADEAARRALEPMTPAQWAEAGLLERCPGGFRAAVQLYPHREWVVAIDWPGRPAAVEKHVMGISGSSCSLAHLTVRRPVNRTLDLGTGCGFQAFRAAAHSNDVLAVDRNPRAVHLAAFNARLNRLTNVRCRAGDLFEPAEDEQFDLIVGNLPFVLAPQRRYLFCDSGLPADSLAHTVIRTAPHFLREGSFCQILCNWAHVAGEDVAARLTRWVEGTGCDAWAMAIQTQDAASYAAFWLRETEGEELVPAVFDDWMAYYQRERIEAVTFGLITLRRAPGRANWFRHDKAPVVLDGAGEALAHCFALRDFLEAARDDRVLLEARLRAPRALCWEQELTLQSDGWSPTESRLRLKRGLSYQGNADRAVVALVTRCQGTEPLRTILVDLAAALGQSLEQIAPPCLQLARGLVADGFLEPAE
jgi:hypothetical protein